MSCCTRKGSLYLDPNILHNNLSSNTLSLLSALSVSNQVSHPYKTIDKIIVDGSLYEKRKSVLRLNCSLLCMYRGVYWESKFVRVNRNAGRCDCCNSFYQKVICLRTT